MNAAELFVRCLENEGVTEIFGIPGEENLAVMDALLSSDIRFITTRHEQGAAFMADVYGRLTGKAGVCLGTLGPGATNLVTGFADANMDRAPIVGIAGQGSSKRLHKESHQIVDLVRMFEPISKYSAQIKSSETINEIVRKSFKDAQAEKPGGSFIEFPEDIADEEVSNASPLTVQHPKSPHAPGEKVEQVVKLIDEARYPIVMAGNGVIRAGASDALERFSRQLKIPVATTFMAKGAMPFSHQYCLGSVGLQAHDYVACGFDRADLVICVGYDMVEYPPKLWNPERAQRIVHIDRTPAEVDAHYILEAGVIGDIATSLDAIAGAAAPQEEFRAGSLRESIVAEFAAHKDDAGVPMKPQRIIWDLRKALEPDDIVISDVGAHKMWMARMYQAERPNTCIISNGFASMGIGVPGAIAAKIAYPERTALTVTGDAGFLMNGQEIETALRIGTPIIILVWNDSEYGLIKWHQMRRYGRESHIKFKNPDLVKHAESYGAKGYRVEVADELLPILRQAISDDTVVVIDCPVDYSENMKLTEKLGKLVCPI
ncbi:MAG: acetolactate synthase large subunit [Gammaproteobacteria bacterium]|nr:acetolactate synthase large subunit [Gammaproteobacteria bacterium]